MAERLNLEGLRYARAVVETGSFSAAARSYGVTQPALSNGIAKLEDHLGEKLFVRSPRGVVPTAFGEQLLPRIESALAAIDGVISEAERWNAPPTEAIRMGVSPLINPALVSRAYSALYRLEGIAKPRDLVLREANMGELREALVMGDLDLIVVPSVMPLPRFEHRVIDSEPVVLIEAEPSGDGPIEIGEIVDRLLILMPDTCGLTTFTRDLLASYSNSVQVYAGEPSGYQVLEEWSTLGLGTAILPLSKLTDPTRAPRPIVEGEIEVELFTEAVWSGRSPCASDLQALVAAMCMIER